MIYANLRAEMTRNAISLAAMAELLGMSSRNLNFKLNGSINFSVKEAQKIRDHFSQIYLSTICLSE